MDMEKLFERLTAKMDANRKADQEKAEADREERRVSQEKLLKEMKAWREEMAAMRNKWVNDNHNEETPTSPDRKPEAAQKAEAPAENATVMPKNRRRNGVGTDNWPQNTAAVDWRSSYHITHSLCGIPYATIGLCFPCMVGAEAT
jgi:hypothetical protein